MGRVVGIDLGTTFSLIAYLTREQARRSVSPALTVPRSAHP